MGRRLIVIVVLGIVAMACGRGRWPSPPPVNSATYQQQHEAWLADQRKYLSEVLPVTGIWPIADGESGFGSDPSLPIPLPAAGVAPLAGTVRRTGDTVTIIPAGDSVLRRRDGSRIQGETEAASVLVGPYRLDLTDVGDERRWVTVIDTAHPAITAPPPLPSYPLDSKWRVAARFARFESPRRMEVPDVRGGTMKIAAPGQLVFRLDGEEFRLTAIGPRLDVWFNDATNGTTTYRGYRRVLPMLDDAALDADGTVLDSEWVVLDFNFADNPPCAYSKFTTCPLPPPGNRLPVAIEAGLKMLPSVEGY